MTNQYKKMRWYITVLLLLFVVPTFAQEKRIKPNRYADAYKKYLGAACPLQEDSIQHFVFFSRDRKSITGHPLLSVKRFKGAQIMYSWRDIEISKGVYDFSPVKEDMEYLNRYGKKLFLQLQDATFTPDYNAVPAYLMSTEFDGGAVLQYNDDGKPEGWVAKRWNKKVRDRFARFLQALGKELDGKIEGINLQETSIGVSIKTDSSFSNQEYVTGIKENMLALKKAFTRSTTMIYANFIPGEWLPSDDKGYLRSIYTYGEQIGVGLGGPDLMVTRPGQLNHTLAMMHEHSYTAPLGIAVQDGNYIGKTGAETGSPDGGAPNLVPMLHAFAKDFLKVKYMFWVDQPPYFKRDVLPCFAK